VLQNLSLNRTRAGTPWFRDMALTYA
jgi:hypothetical protein